MSVQPAEGAGGLPKLLLRHPSGGTAEVYLHGAHVTSWVPAGGTEALFLSRDALFSPEASIRGGIPVIFPQFASTGPLPKHGFARTLPWEWRREESAGEATRAVLQLRDTPATRALWPYEFIADLAVELAERSLTVSLAVRNPGPRTFSFTAALHSYLRVADIRQATLSGLQGVRYRSTLEGDGDRVDGAPELRVEGEVDRVYLDAPAELRLHDPAGGRELRVRAECFRDAVVWNPWAEGARALPDMADDEYLRMLCVEAAQVGEPLRLEPGERWQGCQRLEA